METMFFGIGLRGDGCCDGYVAAGRVLYGDGEVLSLWIMVPRIWG